MKIIISEKHRKLNDFLPEYSLLDEKGLPRVCPDGNIPTSYCPKVNVSGADICDDCDYCIASAHTTMEGNKSAFNRYYQRDVIVAYIITKNVVSVLIKGVHKYFTFSFDCNPRNQKAYDKLPDIIDKIQNMTLWNEYKDKEIFYKKHKEFIRIYSSVFKKVRRN